MVPEKIKKLIVDVDNNILVEMRKKSLSLVAFFFLISCEHSNPAFRASNFDATEAEKIVKAIMDDDVKGIQEEAKKTKWIVNFADQRYETSLLSLALNNDKKEAFEALLDLGAEVNPYNSHCVSPLMSAIRHNSGCNLYYVRRLLEEGADPLPEFFKSCGSIFNADPLVETIMFYNEGHKYPCGIEILNLLTNAINDPKLLFLYNNKNEHNANLIYECIRTRNSPLLKHLVVDLKYQVPDSIYIDEVIIRDFQGYKPLVEFLKNENFDPNKVDEYREKAKNEIISFLEKKVR